MSVKPVAWTPGPWKSEKDRDGRYLILPTRKDYGPIGKVYYLQDVPLIESAPELAEVLEILTAACEKEFISPVTEGGEIPCFDEDSVMVGLDGESPITFGMIRAARKLLARITPK